MVRRASVRGMIVLLAVLMACGGRVAVAASSGEQAALKLVARAEQSFKAGRFDEAAKLLREAHQLMPAPVILYNLARALESGGDLPGAIDAFERYVATEQTIDDRASIEKHVQVLREQLLEREAMRRELKEREQRENERKQRDLDAAAIPPVVDRPSVVIPRSRARRAAPFIVAGIGGLALVAGGGLGGAGLSEHRAAVDDPVGATAAHHQVSAERLGLASTITLSVGGVIAGAGLVWGIVEVARRRR